MYEELKDEGFEIVAVAQDTAGEEAAGPFYDAAEATYTTLIDNKHTLSALYGMVNVPTGVLIDEEGTVVRFDEGTYTREYSAGNLTFGTDDYLPIVRDWVAKGADSEYVQEAADIASAVGQPSDAEARADAAFRLATHFELQGDRERAVTYWRQAQELHPESWNYHRQEWSYDPGTHGAKWFQKFQELEGKPYYAPLNKP